MIGYIQALRTARENKVDWNQEERISKAIITWMDSNWEYEEEIENEGMTDSEFKAWVEAHAEQFARQAAEKEHTTFEAVDRIDYEHELLDDDARFEEEYAAACEFEWEYRNGR